MTPALRSRIEAYLATNPPGWCWLDKALALAEAAQSATLAVEIGVFGGRSLIPIAMALDESNHGLSWGIDPWSRESAILPLDPVTDEAHVKWWNSIDLDAIHTQAAASIRHHNLQHRCGLLRTSSEVAAYLFPFTSIDLLHIDGCHVRAVALRDVQTWLPRCKPGAFVVMDDTNWPSTQAAVRELERHCTQLQVLSAPGAEARLYQKRS